MHVYCGIFSVKATCAVVVVVRFTGGTLNIPASLLKHLESLWIQGAFQKLCVIYARHKCVNVVLAIMYTHV